MSQPSLISRLFGVLWRGLTRLRLALSNLLFLAALALMYFVYIGAGPQALPDKAALLVNPVGVVVDEKSYVEPLQAFLGEPSPADNEVLLRDLIDAIEYAADDPGITALVFELDNLVYVGQSKTYEITRALENFKTSGKPVIAVGDYFSQDQYLLASHADTVIAHPMGGVMLEGYSSYRNYFRDALAKFKVNIHVFKAGEHKSIAEPFERNNMSDGERAITERWLTQLWQRYTSTVEAQRELPAGSIQQLVDHYPDQLALHDGDIARTAQSAGLVDELLGRTESNDYLIDVVGAENEDGLYEAVGFEYYAARRRAEQSVNQAAPRVAVITAEGSIQVGDQPPGTIGGDSLAALIELASDDPDVAAVVLRVNSGGGSVFASEIIRQRLLEVRESGIPVVISMGSVAASGGYYIAAEADQIWATPGTITGSIGVFAAVPTMEEVFGWAGVHTDGVGTTALAGATRLDRPLNPHLGALVRSSVGFSYQTFIGLVAEGRDMDLAEVDALAQGRVWSAADAKEQGLVDELGSLQDSIAAAAELAGLGDYEVEYVAQPLSPRDLLMQRLADRLAVEPVSQAARMPSTALAGLLRPMWRSVEWLGRLDDPGHLYMRCEDCGTGF